MTNSIDTSPPRRPRQRVRDLDAAGWRLVAETFALLAASSAAINLLPFRRVVQLASRSGRASRRPRDGDRVADLLWAVEAVARRVPWRTVCFQKGLALHLMLQRRGLPSLLHYGVGIVEDDELAAHVWISLDRRIVLGGDVVDRFRCLATYPAPDGGRLPG